MTGKILGKITFAEFGTFTDYPFIIGLQLGFNLADKSGIMDGGKYTVNINPACRWGDQSRADAITKSVEFVDKILRDAKINYVSQLVGKPVEVTIENSTFKDFRILTEVL